MQILPLNTKVSYESKNSNSTQGKVNFGAVMATQATARACSEQGLAPLGRVISALKDLVGQPVKDFVQALRKQGKSLYLSKDEAKQVTQAVRAASQDVAQGYRQELRPGIYNEFEPVEFAFRWKDGIGKVGELKQLLTVLVEGAEAHPVRAISDAKRPPVVGTSIEEALQNALSVSA